MGRVWVELYRCVSLVFGLVLRLASADSLVRAYLTADCGEHRICLPCNPMSLSTVDMDVEPSNERKCQPIKKYPYAENKQCGSSTQYSHCDDSFQMG